MKAIHIIIIYNRIVTLTYVVSYNKTLFGPELLENMIYREIILWNQKVQLLRRRLRLTSRHVQVIYRMDNNIYIYI